MTRQEAKALIETYNRGLATTEERARLERWYHKEQAVQRLSEEEANFRSLKDTIWQGTLQRAGLNTPKRFTRWLPYAAAAASVLLTVGWLLLRDTSHEPLNTRLVGDEILPGGNKATLTLADGRVVDLSSEYEGIVVQDGITYLDGSSVLGEQVHEGTGEATSSQVHTLTTPKGGTYRITLPDGSNVWLNSASTLKYPSRFPEGERIVQLEGEAYFSVTGIISPLRSEAEPRQGGANGVTRTPFKVTTSGQTVEVLGTEFNVSAYLDESETKTTLVEGRVRVGLSPAGEPVPSKREASERFLELTPGEQAAATAQNLTKTQVDVTRFTAWREGLFIFDRTPIKDVLVQLSRWYDVGVDTVGLPDRRLNGRLGRNVPIAEVLQLIEAGSDLKFEIVGRPDRPAERRVRMMR